MFLIGLTGGIATGKSYVSQIFSERYGVPVIDSDEIARKVVQPGRKAWKEIKKAFGNEILDSDGQINRELLGSIIFSDPDRRLQLNSITHPEIFKEIYWLLIWYFLRGYQFVIIESPLLFETRIWTKYLHKIIAVTCEDDLQLQRLMDRNHLLESEAKLRVASQLSNDEKCARADFVIENSGNMEDTKRQVEIIYETIRKSRHHWKLRFMAGLLGICTTGLIGAIWWLLRKRFTSSTVKSIRYYK